MTNSEHNSEVPAGGSLEGSNVRHLDAGARRRVCVPGSKGYTYLTGRGAGVWLTSGAKDPETVQILQWCPEVTAHMGGFNPRGRLVKRVVTLNVGKDSATVRMSDLDELSTWEQFPGAIGFAKREVREVLANVVAHQAAKLELMPLHPRWVNGRLHLPPADALPRGYGVTSGSLDDWRALLREIARSPRMVLVSGLAVGGLYVQPLQRQSYMIHVPGASSEGKTTTETAAASFFGDPQHVIMPWSVTKQGPGSWLRSMVLMTGFRDELGAANLNGSQLETLLFTLLQGAERDMSSKTGDYRESQGSWHGALISTGNESILGQIANEGIAARVVEITGPFTLSAEHADTVTDLAAGCHGHGLLALAERGPAPLKFRHMVTTALEGIGALSGVPGRIAQHLAMGVAGAQVIAELAGVPEFARAAPAAARGVLAELMSGLAERGARPGDRLLDALRGSLLSAPAAWPTRERYVKGLTDSFGMAREVFGWDLVGDPDTPGDLAVIPSKLGGIAAEAGINDAGIALQDLKKRKLLTPDRDGKHLQRKIRVGTRTPRAYLISGIVVDDDTPADGDFERPDVPAPRVAEGPCEKCLTPGPCCGPGTVAEQEEPCVLCGEPTMVRTACGAARTGVCQGPKLPPPRGASPAAKARTEARQAAESSSIEALANGDALRLLRALETTHLPRRKTDAGLQKPYMRPELPGITYAAHVVTGWAWTRPHDGETVSLDRSGAWVAAASSVEVAHGALENTGEAEFEGRPGYYQIQRHPWAETDMPDPLAGARGDTAWVPAPTVALLRDLTNEGRWPDVAVLDSYTSVGVRIRSWTEYVNKLRSEAITKYGRDSEQYAEVKSNFGTAMSLMLGKYDNGSSRRIWTCGLQRPDWTHTIQAQASATLFRWADKCRKLGPECAPVALHSVDELVIPAEGLEIVTTTAAPGARSPLVIDPQGIKLGTFKVKAASNV